METFDAPKSSAPRQAGSGLVWNILTGLLLVGVIIVAVLTLMLFANPYLPINPFPPQNVPALLNLPTATPTLKQMPATWTPLPTLEPTFTSTPKPLVFTETPTQYVIPGTPTATEPTPTPSATVKANYPFAIYGAPVAIASTITRPDTTCEWLGVGGQIFDMQNAGMVGYTIQLGGYLSSKSVDILTMSGTALQYGTAGYEFSLNTKPANSKQTLWLQVLDQAGLPLSEKVYFDTYSDCTKNLILINFRQVK